MGWVAATDASQMTYYKDDRDIHSPITQIKLKSDGTIEIYLDNNHEVTEPCIAALTELEFPIFTASSDLSSGGFADAIETVTGENILSARPVDMLATPKEKVSTPLEEVFRILFLELEPEHKIMIREFMKKSAREMQRTGILGILGGGQLGRMLALAAANLGVKVKFLDPAGAAAPAAVAAHAIKGSFSDQEDVIAFASGVDVLTVEIEHVNTAGLDAIEATGITDVQPSASTISVIQDKYRQKVHFEGKGVPVGEYCEVFDSRELAEAAAQYGFPFLLKSKRKAYDGRGNRVINNPAEMEAAVTALGFANGLYAEEFLKFANELAVIVVRAHDGEVRVYPVTETVQMNNICYVTETPAQIPEAARLAAENLAKQAVATLKGVGVFGVEMFLMPDGQVILNEVAPRVHNSGHYTINACATSQFENHIRAVTGMPLGDTSLIVPHTIMLNILGQAVGAEGKKIATELMKRAYAIPGCSVHWYDKNSVRVDRKIGHINIVGTSVKEAREKLGLLDANALASLKSKPKPVVGIVMGSDSDLPTMVEAARTLESLGVFCKVTIVSAHRTPENLAEYARTAHARGLRVIIAGAGGAAHLPGMTAASAALPVIGVPVIPTSATNDNGEAALRSIVFMPKGVPVATVAIGGAANAGLLAAEILATSDPALFRRLEAYKRQIAKEVIDKNRRLESIGWESYLQEQATKKADPKVSPTRQSVETPMYANAPTLSLAELSKSKETERIADAANQDTAEKRATQSATLTNT